MTGSVALDVVIGLVFVFLLYSLLATTIYEALSDLLRFRNRNLEYYIYLMLTDKPKLRPWEWWFPSLFRPRHNLAGAFLSFRSIKQMTRKRWLAKSGPSYMEPKVFSQALVDVLQDNREGPTLLERVQSSLADGQVILDGMEGFKEVPVHPQTRKHIQRLLDRSNKDMMHFTAEVEAWYEHTMDRCASNFKQMTQTVLFLIGFGLAIGFNVNSISIGKLLAKDHVAREYVLAQSAKMTESNAEAVKADSKRMADANRVLGLGYAKPASMTVREYIAKKRNFTSFFGWLITALAISLGSPFWFDLLKKLMKIRSALPQSSANKAIGKTGNQTVPLDQRVG